MNKRYQVFVSSTYLDLKEERREVVQALLELDCFPVGMELFPAADENAWTYIMQIISESDYYLLIVGGRYGSVDEAAGLSYTAKEYDFAVSKQIPVMAFLHGDPGEISAAKSEMEPETRKKLEAFRAKVEKAKLCKFWKTPGELGGLVSRSYAQLIQRQPGVGWVRGDQVPSESAAQTISRLHAEIDDLKAQLERLGKQGPPGADKLAQGEEQFPVKYEYQFAHLPDSHLMPTSLSFSWNKIFLAVAMRLMSASNESEMRSDLEAHIEKETFGNQKSIKLDSEDFDTIKTQLWGLGLIQKSEIGQSGIWTLTPYGKETLLRLRAIPRRT